jgi:hypothetical protein
MYQGVAGGWLGSATGSCSSCSLPAGLLSPILSDLGGGQVYSYIGASL